MNTERNLSWWCRHWASSEARSDRAVFLVVLGFLAISLLALGAVPLVSVSHAQTYQERVRQEELRWIYSQVHVGFLDDQLEARFCLKGERGLAACFFALDTMVSEISPRQIVEISEAGDLAVREVNDVRALGLRHGNIKGFYEYQRERYARFQRISSIPGLKNKIAQAINGLYREWRDRAQEVLKPYQIGRTLNAYLQVAKDPHTAFIPHPGIDRSSAAVSATTLGFSYNLIDDRLVVTKAPPGLNAFDAGIKPGDQILRLDGASISSLGAEGVRKKFFTPADVHVLAEVQRDNLKFSTKVVSQKLRMPLMVQRPMPSAPGAPRIEYLRVSSFPKAPEFCKAVTSALDDLQLKRDGLILDLRDNPGGEVGTSLCMLNAFLGRNRVLVQTNYFFLDEAILSRGHSPDASPAEAIWESKSHELPPQVFSRKTVILTDAGSASASELFAGVMKFYGAAYVVGARTFGKGTFQAEENIVNRYMNLDTIGTYHFPDGTSPQLMGVEPHLKVGLTTLDPQESEVVREAEYGIVPLVPKKLRTVALSNELKVPAGCNAIRRAQAVYSRLRPTAWQKDLQLLTAQNLLECVIK